MQIQAAIVALFHFLTFPAWNKGLKVIN